MKIVWTLASVLAVLVLTVLAMAYGGFVDVSATGPEPRAVEWFLETARHSAVERATEDLEVPRLDDAATLRTGLVHYHEMCVTCHGAPGVAPTELARGLNPMPPDLASSDEGEEPAETFWIVRNGLRMTGMPAFGPTHSDEELWAVAAFVGRLPDLSPEQYAAMVRSAGMSLEAGGGHEHGGGHAGGEGADGGGAAPAEAGAGHDHPAGGGHEH